MLELICATVSVISLIVCAIFATKCKQAEEQRDEYIKKWCETIATLDRTIKLNDTILEKCRTLIVFNERLTDINADLRLEISNIKMIMKENQTCA